MKVWHLLFLVSKWLFLAHFLRIGRSGARLAAVLLRVLLSIFAGSRFDALCLYCEGRKSVCRKVISRVAQRFASPDYLADFFGRAVLPFFATLLFVVGFGLSELA